MDEKGCVVGGGFGGGGCAVVGKVHWEGFLLYVLREVSCLRLAGWMRVARLWLRSWYSISEQSWTTVYFETVRGWVVIVFEMVV